MRRQGRLIGTGALLSVAALFLLSPLLLDRAAAQGVAVGGTWASTSLDVPLWADASFGLQRSHVSGGAFLDFHLASHVRTHPVHVHRTCRSSSWYPYYPPPGWWGCPRPLWVTYHPAYYYRPYRVGSGIHISLWIGTFPGYRAPRVVYVDPWLRPWVPGVIYVDPWRASPPRRWVVAQPAPRPGPVYTGRQAVPRAPGPAYKEPPQPVRSAASARAPQRSAERPEEVGAGRSAVARGTAAEARGSVAEARGAAPVAPRPSTARPSDQLRGRAQPRTDAPARSGAAAVREGAPSSPRAAPRAEPSRQAAPRAAPTRPSDPATRSSPAPAARSTRSPVTSRSPTTSRSPEPSPRSPATSRSPNASRSPAPARSPAPSSRSPVTSRSPDASRSPAPARSPEPATTRPAPSRASPAPRPQAQSRQPAARSPQPEARTGQSAPQVRAPTAAPGTRAAPPRTAPTRAAPPPRTRRPSGG